MRGPKFISLSSKSDFVLSLLAPAGVVDNLSGAYPKICQIQAAQDEKATPTLMHIHEPGQGPALYSVGGSSHKFARVVRLAPEQPQDGLDESLSLCGFVQAAVAGDDAKQAEWGSGIQASADEAGVNEPTEAL